MIRIARYVYLTFSLVLSGCVTVIIEGEPVTMSMRNSQGVKSSRGPTLPPVPPVPPTIIMPTPAVSTRRGCDIPSPMNPAIAPPPPEGQGLVTVEDTENVLVDYIYLLREYIEDREVSYREHYQKIVDRCS